MKIIGAMRVLPDGRGAVRVEEVFDTDIDDLWQACTQPERLARWIAEVSGDLSPGGEFKARFTSGWEGTGRVEVCEPPHRLMVVASEFGNPDEQVTEAILSTDGQRTRLIIEERGLPADHLPGYGSGWQIHVEDLAAHLAGQDRCDIQARWAELLPVYEQQKVG